MPPARRQTQQQDRPARTPRELPVAPEGGFQSYTEAVAWVQTHLPVVEKGSTNTHFGSDYADLADVSHAVLPLTGRAGLVWTTRPTLADDGKMVMHYELRHTSGERVEGTWPLGTGNPQQLGSALTYARRYCLMAVVGVFPGGEDDDGAAASSAQRAQETRSRTQSSGAAAATPPAAQAAEKEPDVPAFLRDVETAVAEGNLQRLENIKQTAQRVYGIKPATEVPGPGGEAMGALSYLRAAVAAAKLHAVASEDDGRSSGRFERVRVTADPAEQQRILSQWETPAPGTEQGGAAQ